MSAQVEIGLSDKELRAGLAGVSGLLKKLEADTKRNASAFADTAKNIAGMFAGGAVIAQARGFVGELARVQDLADRFGETAVNIQRVGNAAKLSGSDLEVIAKTMGKLTVSAAESAGKFELLGISSEKFIAASLDQKVIMLAEAYERATEDQTKMITLMNLLGNRGAEIFPLLTQGAKSLRDQLAEVPVVQNDMVRMAANFDDTIDKSVMHAKAGAASIAGSSIDFAKTFYNAWASVFEGVAKLENPLEGFKRRQAADKSAGGDGAKKAAKAFDAEAYQEASKSADELARKQQKADDDAAKAWKELDEAQRKSNEAKMSDEERLVELTIRRDEAAANAADASLGEVEQIKALQKEIELTDEILKLEQQISDTQSKADAEAEAAAAKQLADEEAAAQLVEETAAAKRKADAESKAGELRTQIAAIMGDLDGLDQKNGTSTRADGRKRISARIEGGIDGARARAEHNVAFARERIAARTAVAFGYATPAQATLDRTLARGGTEKQAREAQMLPVLQRQLEVLERLAE